MRQAEGFHISVKRPHCTAGQIVARVRLQGIVRLVLHQDQSDQLRREISKVEMFHACSEESVRASLVVDRTNSAPLCPHTRFASLVSNFRSAPVTDDG